MKESVDIEVAEVIEDNIEVAVDKLEFFYLKGYELGMDYAPKLILAILTLFIGLWIIRGVRKVLIISMEKSGVESTVIHIIYCYFRCRRFGHWFGITRQFV